MAHLLPVGAHFSNIKPLLDCANILVEAKHFLGATRFRTIRVHCLNLEFILKQGVPLPWSEVSLRNLLNQACENEFTTSRLNQMWRTVTWLAKRFGALDPETIDRLVKKKEAVLESLITTTVNPQRQAVVPSLHMVMAMEQGTISTSSTFADRLILGIARFMVGSSARFNDIQHCRPSDFRLTSNSLELIAWQTKTTGNSGNHKKPCP